MKILNISDLEILTEIKLPELLKIIGMDAFLDCNSLKEIDIPPFVID